jgi:hypothetical protein
MGLMSWLGYVPKRKFKMIDVLQNIIDSQDTDYNTLKKKYDTLQTQLGNAEKSNQELSEDLDTYKELYFALKKESDALKNEHGNCATTISELEKIISELQVQVDARDPSKVHAELIKKGDQLFGEAYEKAVELARETGKELVENLRYSEKRKNISYLDNNISYFREFAKSLNLKYEGNGVDITTKNTTKEPNTPIKDLKPIDFLSDLNKDGITDKDGIFDYWGNVKDKIKIESKQDIEWKDDDIVILAKYSYGKKVCYTGSKFNINGDDNNDYKPKARELLIDLFVNYMVGVVQAELSKESNIKYSEVKNISELVIRMAKQLGKDDYRNLISEAYNNAPPLASAYKPVNLEPVK